MIIEAGLWFLAQAAPPAAFGKAREIDAYALCSCKTIDPLTIVRFQGFASDAEMTLGEDGKTANARQATIFRVLKGAGADVPPLARVYHVTDPAKCGISFDYGKRYDVAAVKKDGVLETDWCRMGKPREVKAD